MPILDKETQKKIDEIRDELVAKTGVAVTANEELYIAAGWAKGHIQGMQDAKKNLYDAKDLNIARDLGARDVTSFLIQEKWDVAEELALEIKRYDKAEKKNDNVTVGIFLTVNLGNQLEKLREEGRLVGYVNKLLKDNI